MVFNPYGYDERQFCSPAFDLPMGCLMRSVHGTFPEYHTSADNSDFVKPEALDQSYAVVASLLDLLDANHTYVRTDGRGEPQLGRRGLYRAIAGQKEAGGPTQMDLLWVLNLADGKNLWTLGTDVDPAVDAAGMVYGSPELFPVIVPLRDGVAICRKS